MSPTPFTDEEIDVFAADKRRRAVSSANQEPVSQSIDLYEAMARALKYNLDHQLEMSEVALRYAELSDGEFDMLPDLVARVDWSDRSNTPFQSSITNDGEESDVLTSSQDPGSYYAGLELSWDVLDYGLSYYRSKQNADRVLIAEEQRRSTINRVIEDVRTAYWRAVAAERLLGPISALEKSANAALEDAKGQVAAGEGDQLEALRYQREMYETIQRAQTLRRDLSVAKNQLAALMNLPQNSEFRVRIPARSDLRTPITELSSEKMTEMALRNRPEMREIAYRLRINEVEDDAAVLELLPSIKAYPAICAQVALSVSDGFRRPHNPSCPSK
ncbi:MAG: TolC family protein [Roseobacter sp.]